MAEISERDAAFVARIERAERPALVWACVLLALGMGYAAWGVLRFDPGASTEAHMSFDRPVSSLGALYGPYAPLFRVAKPATDLESFLLAGIQRNMDFSVGIMMTLMRVFLGVLMAVMGMVTLCVRLERRRLLNVIERLRAP